MTTTHIGRFVLILFLTSALALAQTVTIQSATRTGDSGSCDVKAKIDPQGSTVTLTQIRFLDKKGKVVKSEQMSSEWSTKTVTSWTYTIPKSATHVEIVHSNGTSNRATITGP